MSKKKKVWILNHYATFMYKNKAGRHYWFAENLKKMDYDVTIFCANTHHNTSDFIEIKKGLFTSDILNEIPFLFIKTPIALGNGMDRIKNMVTFYKNVIKVAIKQAKIEGKPDVIIASSVHPLTMVAGIKIAKKLKVPCICEVRDLWPEAIFAFNKARENSLLGRILVAGEHWIYKNADSLIFTKEGDTDYIKEKKWDISQGGDIDLSKAHYINNGVDIDAFDKSMKDFQIEDAELNDGKFNVAYVGALRPVNNVGNILDAASVLKENLDVQFLIYGDGNQREELERRVTNEGLTNVKIKGFINRKYIPYILSKSSVNILNYSQSQYNWTRGNSSNKLFEYMASGKPIISTVKMGYSILEKYNCGIELENASAQELADAIIKVKKMSREEYQKMSANARKGAGDFDFKILTKKLIQVINGVMKEGMKND